MNGHEEQVDSLNEYDNFHEWSLLFKRLFSKESELELQVTSKKEKYEDQGNRPGGGF
jgi:hypothetical protein